eukprot:COSAG03_NODE_2248_length_2959_cov_33.941958_1_plen_62_part_00
MYGYMIHTTQNRWPSDGNYTLGSDSMRSFTHDDLNELLTSLGYTKFASKKKHEKIHMLMKH